MNKFLIALLLIATPGVADVSVPASAKVIYSHQDHQRLGLYKVGNLYLSDTSGNTMRVAAPELADDAYDFIFPASDGDAAQCLTTDGAEGLTWEDVLTPGIGSIVDADISASAGITRTKIAAGGVNQVVINDASGLLTSEISLSPARGGTGVVNDTNATLTLGVDPVEFVTTGDTVLTLPEAGTVATLDGAEIFTNKEIDADLNTLSNIEDSDIKGGAAIDPTKIGDGSVDSSEFTYLGNVTSDLQDQLDDKVDDTEKGASGGVATLDGGGKIPVAQLPNSIMSYEGTWAASTNTPTLANGVGSAGDVYLATDAGTVDFGAGGILFAAGDWAVYSGTVWQRSINSNSVLSVNGFTGVVSLNLADLPTRSHTSLTDIGTNTHAQIDTALSTASAHIANTSNPHSVTAAQVGLGNVDNTSDATKNAAAVTLTNKTIASPTVTGTLLLQNPSGAQPTLDLSEDPDSGTNKVIIQSTATLAGDYTLTLPVDDGAASEVLTTDGSGVLSWTNPSTASAPVGAVIDYAGLTAPTGWLFVDGASLLRATYPALFAIICPTASGDPGATAPTATCPYGTADDTHFYLPDAQGRVTAGQDDMSGVSANRLTSPGSGIDGDVLGNAGGLETAMAHTHSIDHDHASVTSGAGTSHTHGAGTYVDAVTGTFASSTHTHNHNHRWVNSGAQTYNSAGTAISLSLAQAASGSGSSQFIRGDAAANWYTENDATAPSATASVNGANAIVGSSGSESAHTHAVNLPNFTGSSGSSGTGTSHGTVQPTLVLNKIIKH